MKSIAAILSVCFVVLLFYNSTFAIAIAMMALVMATIYWVKPSPQQYRQAALRQKAMQLGFKVSRNKQCQNTMIYQLPISSNQSLSLALNRQGQWQGSEDTELLALLAQLPKAITAIEVIHHHILFTWDETTDDSILEDMQQVAKVISLKPCY